MKKGTIAVILLVILFFVCLFPLFSYAGGSYDVEKVIGAKVSPGTYKINVTRESNDMYKVTGQDIYIKTRFCFEFAIMQDAILEITSSSGYSIGQIHFMN